MSGHEINLVAYKNSSNWEATTLKHLLNLKAILSWEIIDHKHRLLEVSKEFVNNRSRLSYKAQLKKWNSMLNFSVVPLATHQSALQRGSLLEAMKTIVKFTIGRETSKWFRKSRIILAANSCIIQKLRMISAQMSYLKYPVVHWLQQNWMHIILRATRNYIWRVIQTYR